MKVDAIDPSSLVDRVVEAILETIKSNGLGVGDSLPTEIALTAELGVSRTVLREALARLRMIGLIESRKKRGIVITEPDVFAGSKQIMDAAFLNEQTQLDLCEMRLVLEIGMADLLFMRKTDEDLVELEAIAKRFDAAINEDERVELEIEFHTGLYRIAKNDLLLRFQLLLQPFFHKAAKLERKIGQKWSAVSHQDLIEELRTGTPESFRNAMRTHVSIHFDNLEKAAGEAGNE
jgi:GntR family transcriptional repressor for pyruvate dehydrogenase complex